MRASAIILGAGSGLRLGASLPKLFVELGGQSLLVRSLRTLREVESIEEAVVTIPSGLDSAAREQLAAADLRIPVKLIPGGMERQHSVRIALAVTSAEAELIVVHDAARPLAPADLFRTCLEAAARSGAAIVAMPLSDTLKAVSQSCDEARSGKMIGSTIPRAGLYRAQTPQAFRRDVLIRAHQRGLLDAYAATDDSELVERLGVAVEIVEGSALNLKITTPADLEIASAIISRREQKPAG